MKCCCRFPWSLLIFRKTIPGPHTLLTSLSAEENIDRLHWSMSRFHGYVGIAELYGPQLHRRTTTLGADRGPSRNRAVIYFDRRWRRAASAAPDRGRHQVGIPAAQGGAALDSIQTPAEIDRRLSELETWPATMAARWVRAFRYPVSSRASPQWAKA